MYFKANNLSNAKLSNMLTIRKEKDDFTGLCKINSSFYGLNKFISFDGPSDIYIRYMLNNTGISDAFDLLYLEAENGQGNMVIRVCSSVAKYSGNTDWPRWDDSWPMIIDGERVSLISSSVNTFESDYELKVYDLPIDIFYKLCNAKEIKFSLRGRNKKVEGVFLNQHQTILKAFEQFCFGDENLGNQILGSLGYSDSQNNGNGQTNEQEDSTSIFYCYSCKSNNIVPNEWESFSCHNCGKSNSVVRPKNLTNEEKTEHESKVVDLIREKKIADAIKYYAANFGFTDDASKIKVKELAEKNGLASIYKRYENGNLVKGCLFLFVIIAIVLFLVGTCTKPSDFGLSLVD